MRVKSARIFLFSITRMRVIHALRHTNPIALRVESKPVVFIVWCDTQEGAIFGYYQSKMEPFVVQDTDFLCEGVEFIFLTEY
jgi:hypothetical protein